MDAHKHPRLYLTASDAATALPPAESLAQQLDRPPFRPPPPARACSLPPDVLWQVATALPAVDLRAATASCAAWRDGFGAAVARLTPGALVDGAALAKRFPRLVTLDLGRAPASHVTDEALGALTALPCLQHLSLRGCRRVTPAGLLSLLAAAAPRLVSLDVSGATALGGRGGRPLAAALPAALPRLVRFRADRVGGVVDADVVALATTAPGLTQLSLGGGARLGGPALAALAALPALASLSLAGCDTLDDDALALLAPTKSLARLVLDGCPRVTGAGLAALAAAPLASVSARDAGVDDAGLAAMAASPPPITHLTLDFCAVGDAGAAALGALSTLSHLSLAHTRLAGTGLAAALVRLPRLVELTVADCSSLCGGELGAAVGGARALTRLDASGCERLDTASLAALAHCSTLARLDASRCERVTDAALAALAVAPAARSLTDLALASCPGVGDAGAIALAGLPRLARLDLASTRVGDAGAAALAAAPALLSANLACTLVGAPGLAAFAARPAAGLAPATANAWGSPAAVASLCAGGRPPSAGLRFAHLDRQDSVAAAA